MRSGSEGQPSERALQENTDYLYCPVCNTHVACRRVPTGGWEVECQDCVGECVGCSCYLKRFCFGSRDQFPPMTLHQGSKI